MTKSFLPIAVVSCAIAWFAGTCAAQAGGTSAPTGQSSLAARVRDTGFIQLTADSFAGLTPDQKMDAYWLYRAAVAVDPIAYDQNSADGLREKHLLEAILTHLNGIDPGVAKKIAEYTMLYWGNHGNHDANTSVKIMPDFTPVDPTTLELSLISRQPKPAAIMIAPGYRSPAKSVSLAVASLRLGAGQADRLEQGVRRSRAHNAVARLRRADENRCRRHRRVSEESPADQSQGSGSVWTGRQTGHIPNDDIAARPCQTEQLIKTTAQLSWRARKSSGRTKTTPLAKIAMLCDRDALPYDFFG